MAGLRGGCLKFEEVEGFVRLDGEVVDGVEKW